MDLWLMFFMVLGVIAGYVLSKNNIINIIDKIEKILIGVTVLLVFLIGYSAGSFASGLERSVIADLTSSTLYLFILSVIFSVLLTGIFEFLMSRVARRRACEQ